MKQKFELKCECLNTDNVSLNYCRLGNNHDGFNSTMFTIYYFSAKLNPSLILLCFKNVSMLLLKSL